VAHHRLAAHERNLQRLVLVHQIKYAADEIVSPLVAQFAQSNSAAQMS
jgi:hypothetical protein